MNKIKFLSLVMAMSLAMSSCGAEKPKDQSEEAVETVEEETKEEGVVNMNQLELPVKGEKIAVMKTNFGDIKLRLFPEAAPKAVENFMEHSKDGYYDGVSFHRVIEEFMIQGGDPDGTGAGGDSIWGGPFEDEFDLSYRNYRGALSMANAGPNTNGSQFFIVHSSQVRPEQLIDQMRESGEEGGYPEPIVEKYEELGGTPHLDFRHTVFGQVFEGMDIVDKIATTEVDGNDRPLEPVVIETISIEEY